MAKDESGPSFRKEEIEKLNALTSLNFVKFTLDACRIYEDELIEILLAAKDKAKDDIEENVNQRSYTLYILNWDMLICWHRTLLEVS
uniref:Uncharacterized protein n=1 Tax=Ditylenchus dipsaci TaxID=166011 RepID=A0A915CZB3_9BILA